MTGGKEMLGGCCVCADDRGYEENPLVYCDGPGCDVAVHQGCYGILSVPDDNWYCAKCADKSGAGVNARCDLCTSHHGALKRTSTGGWAHVICALYIPEVKFGDVHSMEPVVIAEVPQERFAQTCYICESPKGACMQCNRAGCKKHFHVTCAQHKGLLCEEGGDSKNVKYCGYCSHHHKKIQGEPGIKFIPAFRPLRRNGREPASSGHSGASTPSLLNNGAPTPTPPLTNGPELKFLPNPVTLPFVTVATAFTHSTALPAPTPPLPTTSALLPPVSHPPPVSVPQPIPHSLPSSAGSENPPPKAPTVPATLSRPPHTPAKRGRPPGSTNANRAAALADGEEKPKRPRKTTKKTVKSLLESVSHVVEDTVSSFQAERVASQQLQLEQQQQNATAAALLGLQAGSNNFPTSSSYDPSSILSGLSSAFSTPDPPTPAKPRLDANPNLQGLPSSLEQLLERQWEQGSQFLMEQSQHFDVASLLNCLHQLKSENGKLEKDIGTLSSRKDHLLAVNARLSVPYSTQSPRLEGAAVAGSSLGSPASQSSLKGNSTLSSPTQRLPQPAGMSPVLGSAYRAGSAKPPESSPDRAFLIPRTPTPLLHSNPSAAAIAALHHQYANITQDQLLLLQQQMAQQQSLAAFSGLASFLPSSSQAQQQKQPPS